MAAGHCNKDEVTTIRFRPRRGHAAPARCLRAPAGSVPARPWAGRAGRATRHGGHSRSPPPPRPAFVLFQVGNRKERRSPASAPARASRAPRLRATGCMRWFGLHVLPPAAAGSHGCRLARATGDENLAHASRCGRSGAHLQCRIWRAAVPLSRPRGATESQPRSRANGCRAGVASQRRSRREPGGEGGACVARRCRVAVAR